MSTQQKSALYLLVVSVAAVIAAYHLFIVGFCMLVWLVRFRADVPTIPVSFLPLIVGGSGAVLLIARSAAILVLERRSLDQAAA